MRHVYFSLLTIYACSFVTSVQAAHLKALGLRALHTSAALSTWMYREFPKDNPYLFVVTHNCLEKNQVGTTRFQHAVRSFNEGKGILLAASSYRENPQEKKGPHIAHNLLQSIDINCLKKLIDRDEDTSPFFSPIHEVTYAIIQGKILNASVSSPVKGIVAVAFRHLKDLNNNKYEDCLFTYPIASDSQKNIVVQSIGYGEVENYDIIGKIDYFKDLDDNRPYPTNGWLVTTEGCSIARDVIQDFRMSLQCGFGAWQNAYRYFIQDFAKAHIPADKDARLIVLNRYRLQKAIQGNN